MLDTFLRDRTARDHLSLVSIKKLHAAFLRQLPPADHASWARGRFLVSLGAAGVEVALVDRRYYAIGLALLDSPVTK